MQYYYINSSSEQVGPLSIEGLEKEKITSNTLVWKEGMKEWTPASQLPELKSLFETREVAPAVVPPPIPGSKPPPVPGPTQTAKPDSAAANTAASRASPEKPTVFSGRSRKLIIAAAIGVAVIAFAAFFFLGSAEPKNQVYIAADADSSSLDDDTAEFDDEPKKDTTKVIDLDSMANKLKWDTTGAVSDTNATASSDVSFLPGFGSEPAKKEKKVKKTTGKKDNQRTTHQNDESEQVEDRTPQPRNNTAEKINPLRSLSIKGTFRKNILFEAILEGTIYNRSSEQLRDIIVQVRFLDASGQSISTKRFTHHGPVPPGSNSPFRFKAPPPKGARGAAFEIVNGEW